LTTSSSGSGTFTPPSPSPSPSAPRMGSRKYWKKYSVVWLLLLVWAAILVTLVIWGISAGRHAGSSTSLPDSCTGSSTARPPESPPREPAVLKARTTVTTGVPFGRSYGNLQRDVEYDVASGADSLTGVQRITVEKSLFQTAAGDAQLSTADIHAWAEVRQPSRVILHVCFQRGRSTGLPGLYTGTISITDERVARVDVPFNVSLSFPTWQYIFALWVLALLPATLYVWLLLGSFTTTELSISNFKAWIFSRNAIIALGTGATVSFGLVTSTYFRTEEWGASITEATTLFGAAFAGFVAAASGVTGAGQDKRPHQNLSQPHQNLPRPHQNLSQQGQSDTGAHGSG